MIINWEDFEKIEMRIGTIVKAEVFVEARRPAYKLWVDLGEKGVKKSSAQLTLLYKPEDLVGMQVLCVCNFPPRQVGPFLSEILVTGVYNENNEVVLITSERKAPNGALLK